MLGRRPDVSGEDEQAEKRPASKEEAVEWITKLFSGREASFFTTHTQKLENFKRSIQKNEAIEKAFEEALEDLRNLFWAILAQEQKELVARSLARQYDELTCEKVYQASCLLTEFWPLNSPYELGEGDDSSKAGLPVCPLSQDAILANGDRVITATGYQFDAVHLFGSLTLANLRNRNPVDRQLFNARDLKAIDRLARQKGFTPPSVHPEEAVPNTRETRLRFSSRFEAFMWASYALWFAGSILGVAGVGMAVASALYLAGSAAVLLGSLYMLYKAVRVLVNVIRDDAENRQRYGLYQQELAQVLQQSRLQNNAHPEPVNAHQPFSSSGINQAVAANNPNRRPNDNPQLAQFSGSSVNDEDEEKEMSPVRGRQRHILDREEPSMPIMVYQDADANQRPGPGY